MMDGNETAPGKRRRLKVSHVLVILLLVGIGYFAFFRLSLKSKLQARIDAIRAAGYPVTCAELDKWYTIPEDAENAAYTIMDAFWCYRDWDKTESESLPLIGQAKLPARTEPLPEDMKAAIAQYVADNNETLMLLHEAATIEHSRYPVDLSLGVDNQLNHLTNLRNGIMLLNLDAILHAENNKPQSVISSVISGFGLARSLAKEPVTISQFSRAGCQSRAVTTIEYCINRIELADEQLVELIECIHNTERNSDMTYAFIGERCMGLSFLKSPGSVNPDSIEGIPLQPILELYKALGLADADAIIYLDTMDGYIKSAQLPSHRRQEAVKAIDAKLQSTSQIHILLHIITPALSRITAIDLRAIAHLRTARTALAIECYRLATNKLPDKLADLVPTYLQSVPKDPFDGNELRYKRLGPGFVVYSIGEDLSDDVGKEKPPRKTKESPNWDVTFTIER